MKRLMLRAIRFYQRKISPHLPNMCRYYPSCSCYAVEAIETHGAIKGGALAFARLMRCNVFFPGGIDPVPPARGKKTKKK
ncbi:MAG: membrane protein insertion efficiency factor YidD [Clostridium sp.]|jgi:putative membrane protein insertion efficiency factor|nr:membrane protein insertion efficiency factor YidD [Clostridium sp.]